jgi:DHA2 family multidrug resistance protein
MTGVAPAARLPLTISVMLAATLTAVDTTIANVALPHMQGGVSASQEQIAWVLTSYIVASALVIPLTGWLSGRLGRKRLLLISITGFTIASMLCGLAATIPEIVFFRVLQGAFGAPLMPLSQALMLDIYPPERHGQAMAVWGLGTILGPMSGPIFGGYLTDQFSWRWVFYINLPLGILALAGCSIFLSNVRSEARKPFDFLGFATIAALIGSIQLILDRGPSLDWFTSAEIWTYLIAGIIGLWVIIIHTLTAPHPFFDRRLLTDRNFVVATAFGVATSIILMSSFALLPPITQGLLGYTAYESGMLSLPRGVGSVTSMLLVGRLMTRFDPRLLVATGMTLVAISSWQTAHFDLVMGAGPIVISGFLQGFGMSLMFVPSTTLAFVTVAQSLRAEASAISTLVRTMGGSAGIAIMQALAVANTQTMHQSIAAKVNPADPMVAATLPQHFDLASVGGLFALNHEVTRQAMMIAYLNDFRLMVLIIVVFMPMLLFMKRPLRAPLETAPHAIAE